ncbi:NADPH:quinone reductase [Micromonospora rhizosphaerae]|uniref:NADPH:quinone reductase n=1 Tax=Micromonospora rhizosphaerae TaxID=568872 RepID=A0A1C6RHQ6_9ACTN|nr:NADP-dependent oxidoreductase [Micromonospora rhizosphaerae]SCL16724.1 NADPH:quinone reductase [Micromonospora rhizosphaerae]
MRAIVVTDFGATPVLTDLPEPTPEPEEVLVRVTASSVNGIDAMVAAGTTKGMMEHRFPVVVGKDFAGTVAAVGSGVSRLTVGDPVFGAVIKPALGDGAFGEYVTVPAGYVTRIPAGLDHTAASALALAGTAALNSVDAVAPTAGETVLIAGATGGVGAYAIQFAAARGATVIATAKPGAEAEFVRDLGAAHTVDYTGDLPAQVRAIAPDGVPAVLHLAGDATALADLLAPGGRLASTLGFGPDALNRPDATATAIWANPDQATLDTLAEHAAAGRLRIPVTASYRLHEVPKALADFAAGTLGKLTITID